MLLLANSVGFTNFGSSTELLAFDQGLLVSCFSPAVERDHRHLFIYKIVVYDGGQLFRPFLSFCIFQNLSCLYDGGRLFRPSFLLFYYPGSPPNEL